MVSKRFLMIAGILALALAMVGFAWMRQPQAGSDSSTYKDPNEWLKKVSNEVPEFGGVFLSDNQSVLGDY